jgi:hypothetical protein
MNLNEVSPKEWDEVLNTKLKADKQDSYQKNPSSNLFEWDRLEDKKAEEEDMVNKPSHYNTGEIECIEAIEASMSSVEFRGYLKGTCMKYQWRYTYKGKPVQDLQKAGWYLNKLTNMVAEENS